MLTDGHPYLDLDLDLDRPLYLHYLDRELAQSVGCALRPADVVALTNVLLLGTEVQLYCGLSLLYENPNVHGYVQRYFEALIGTANLDTVSNQHTRGEFVEAKQRQYQHDVTRYPNYYGGAEADRPYLSPTRIKAGDTTADLVAAMTAWTADPDGADSPEDRSVIRGIAPAAARALAEREEKGVTFPLFRPYLNNAELAARAEGIIRRKISQEYTRAYVESIEGDIPTGIRGLQFYDERLSRDFPAADVVLLGQLLRCAGLYGWVHGQDEHRLDQIIGVRRSPEHNAFVARIRWIVRSLRDAFWSGSGGAPRSRQHRRDLTLTLLRRLGGEPVADTTGPLTAATFLTGSVRLEALASRLNEVPTVASALDRNRGRFLSIGCDVLLVTATDSETKALREVFGEGGYPVTERRFTEVSSYAFFRPVNGARTAQVQCHIGAGGPGGAILTIAEAIRVLRPTAVIMVGIAFGLDRRRQRIGDVLVAEQVTDYEAVKVGTGVGLAPRVIQRGPRVDVSARLLDRAHSALLDFDEANITWGLMLSGDKLIDNVDYRDALLATFPEAVGGEMEGRGLYASASRAKVDWLLVKSVSDWADGTKSTRKAVRQTLAARSAATAVLAMLQAGGVHY